MAAMMTVSALVSPSRPVVMSLAMVRADGMRRIVALGSGPINFIADWILI